MTRINHAIIVVLALLSVTACGGSSAPASSSTSPSIASSLKLASETSTSSSISASKAVGQGTAAGLSSLKYYITSITICESIDTSGTAYSNPTGCLELYSGSTSALYSYDDPNALTHADYIRFADAARGSTTGFVDLMDDTSRATLATSTTLTSDDVRSYNYGYINWYLPIKITAAVTMDDASIYRTQDGTTEYEGDNGPFTIASALFSAVNPATEAVVVLGNGGSWFKFQNPFVISASDITSNTQFALDLTFNPDGLIKAYSSGIGGCGGCILRDSGSNQMLVPMIALTPVPHRSTESVTKETYLATVTSGADDFNLRIELYSVEGDATRTIYGIDAETLVNASTTTAVSPFPKIAFIASEDAGTLALEDYRGASGVEISGFDRKSAVGETFTATVHCSAPSDGGFMVDGCGGDGEPTTLSALFTLDSISTLR